MQAEITFPGNTIQTKAVDRLKVFTAITPVKEFQQFIEENDWDERILRHEKHINSFSWGIIIASVIFLTPVCITILIR